MLDLRLAIEPSAFGSSPIKIVCLNPAHDDPNASMAVYEDHIHCFGCGFHRNDWDEALSLLLGITIVEAREVADKYEYRGTVQRVREDADLTPLPRGRASLYARYLHDYYPGKLAWFRSRGLSDTTIAQEHLGYDGYRYTIPIYASDGTLVTIRYRADYTRLPTEVMDGIRPVPIPKYSGIRGRNQMFMYGAHWLRPDSKYVIICEGELDALLLRQLGNAAVSATNGAGQAYRLPDMVLHLCPTLTTVYIATDQDRGDGKQTRKGEEAAVKVAEACSELGLQAIRLSWLIGKDVTEHYTSNGNKLDFIKGVWNGKRFVY